MIAPENTVALDLVETYARPLTSVERQKACRNRQRELKFDSSRN